MDHLCTHVPSSQPRHALFSKIPSPHQAPASSASNGGPAIELAGAEPGGWSSCTLHHHHNLPASSLGYPSSGRYRHVELPRPVRLCTLRSSLFLCLAHRHILFGDYCGDLGTCAQARRPVLRHKPVFRLRKYYIMPLPAAMDLPQPSLTSRLGRIFDPGGLQRSIISILERASPLEEPSNWFIMARSSFLKAASLLFSLQAVSNGQTTSGNGTAISAVPASSPTIGTVEISGTPTTFRPIFTIPASADEGADVLPNIDDPEAVNAQDVCPGYKASQVQEDDRGLTAVLTLAGAPCNVYGNDVEVLNLKVEYQASNRLAINISPANLVSLESTERRLEEYHSV